ncbi:MAG: AAA family ATPase [Sulfurimonas sp.]|nr:AAA family ATPase [Sulfurimonas sp.]
MKNSIYDASKNVFLDNIDVREYIQLDRVSTLYKSLKDSVRKPLKMILLYGKPGTGKSMLLSKLHHDLSSTQKVFIYSTPILDDSEFFKSLARDLFDVKYLGELNFTQLMLIVKSKLSKNYKVPLVLLDEAQLYSSEQMEKIRLLSDTRIVKFVITLHKTDKEDIIAKEHFQTRIWESIELKNSSKNELRIYIQKKLMKANCFDSANMFSKNRVNLIHKITKGNYRDTNKLLYTFFNIYSWYCYNDPSAIDSNIASSKIIEMSAIQTGLINA